MATDKWLISAWDLIEWLNNIDLENHHRLMKGKKAKWLDTKGVRHMIQTVPKVEAVSVEQYMALREQYHTLRENFIDYYCSGIPNVAPYCLNKCEDCVTVRGWCKFNSDKCKGFNPAEVII